MYLCTACRLPHGLHQAPSNRCLKACCMLALTALPEPQCCLCWALIVAAPSDLLLLPCSGLHCHSQGQRLPEPAHHCAASRVREPVPAGAAHSHRQDAPAGDVWHCRLVISHLPLLCLLRVLCVHKWATLHAVHFTAAPSARALRACWCGLLLVWGWSCRPDCSCALVPAWACSCQSVLLSTQSSRAAAGVAV